MLQTLISLKKLDFIWPVTYGQNCTVFAKTYNVNCVLYSLFGVHSSLIRLWHFYDQEILFLFVELFLLLLSFVFHLVYSPVRTNFRVKCPLYLGAKFKLNSLAC